MATPSLRATGPPRRVPPQLPTTQLSTTRAMRYQLNVLALDAAEVIEAAGGWLFDRAMAGWDVNVLLAGPADGRALRILGAHRQELAHGFESVFGADEQAAGLAVSAALLSADNRVAAAVAQTVRTGVTEVAVWGEPAGLGASVECVQYQLSAAAGLFKRHALSAAACDVVTGDVETLYRAGYRPLDSDLIPVG